MSERRWQAQNAAAKSVLPPPDEIPTQMSPFSNERWDLDLAENIRRKEIQRSYVYNRRYFQQPYRAPEQSIPANPPQEPETTTTPNQELQDIPQVTIKTLADGSDKDYFKVEAPQVLKPKSVHEIKFETPAPPNLYPVLKFPERRIKPETVYHLPSKEAFIPRPNGLPPEEPLPMEHPPKPQFFVFKDYQPERPKPMHYGVHVPLWQFSSNERDLTKKNKLGRSLELKINRKNSNAGGASTKSDISKPVFTQSSHEDIAKVLKTLGGISKSLGYKILKEDSAKNFKDKKKNIKMVAMKAPDSKEFDSKLPTPIQNLQSKTSATDLSPSQSQSTLTRKVAEVLSCVTSKKPLSELNLLKIGTNLPSFKNGNVSVPNFPFAGSTNTFPPNNFNSYENNKVPTYLVSNKVSIGEKSRSSEYFKYLNLLKQPSKSLSFDNDQSLKTERKDSKPKGSHSISRNTSETLIRKVDLTKSKDSSHFRNSPPSFMNSFESIDWRRLGHSELDSTQQLRSDTISVYSYPRHSIQNQVCPHRSQSGSAKLNLNTGTPSCFSSLLPPMSTNSKFCCCNVKKQKRESLKAESKHLLAGTNPAENDSKKLSKMSVRVCHCPHLHTENAIKKICFHNCVPSQNFYSSKIFRVNYLSKDERQKRKQSCESDMKQGEEPVMEGYKAATSDVLEKKESQTRSVNRVLSSNLVNRDLKKSTLSFKTSEHNKVISKTSLKARKSLSNSKTEKKEKLKKTRTFPEYTRPNVLLWNNENHVRILGQSNIHGKKGTSEKKSFEGTRKPTAESKPMKIAPQVKESVRRVVRPSSRLRSRDSKKLSNDEKALEELAVLEKLFSKLNTVERSLRKQKMADSHHQCRSLSKMALKKNKGEEESRLSFNQMKSLLMLDSPTEEECQRRRKKLRSAIIRHVQNWLKLDFDEF